MEDLRDRLADLEAKIRTIMVRLDILDKEQEIARIEESSTDPDFWLDQAEAQKAMRQLADLRGMAETWRGLEHSVKDAIDLSDLAMAEADDDLIAEVLAEVSRTETTVKGLEFQLSLGGEHDRKNAILAIHAGAGGTESQDWADMLLRMYLRWAEKRRYETQIIDMTPGEEAVIKSATVEITGRYAYGYLKAERGVHRLVRLSPYDAAHRRHTSFVLVEVMPEADDAADVTVDPDDLKIDVFRSSGAGGQNVQKNSTAVRLTHLPSGLVVTCQNERSQLQNRDTALRVLQSRLLEIELEKQEVERATLKGKHVSAGWGNQIRSYVLHPYNLVKDLRTGHETSNTMAVLDGDLDAFINAYLEETLADGIS
ncbi:MAG: peptide chain release factor 2 [Dehalococcoidia bacterium]|nr:peptide chain release factor 2 [Dehalococcoidia bacterium]